MQLRITGRFFLLVILGSLLLASAARAQQQREEPQARTASVGTRSRTSAPQAGPGLTGVYRIDVASSDRLYSVVAGATSNLPFGEQQRFFIDLAVRLTPPDLLAIERKGSRVSIASSRAARITFDADGVTQSERATGGRLIQTRAVLSGDSLTVSTRGSVEDSFTVTFETLDGGRRLRVVRRLYAPQLNEPVVVRSIYDRISDVAQWNIYGEPSARPSTEQAEATAGTVKSLGTGGALNLEANALRAALNAWVEATNSRDVMRLIAFYMPELKAFYLARNVQRSFVREERTRDFGRTELINVRAEEPEIIFDKAGSTAVMRFRKRYTTEARGRRRQGEVIQELRWRKTAGGWRIFSERDIRVIR